MSDPSDESEARRATVIDRGLFRRGNLRRVAIYATASYSNSTDGAKLPADEEGPNAKRWIDIRTALEPSKK